MEAGSVGSKQDDAYIRILQEIIDGQASFLGRKLALKQARRAPIEIDSEGSVTGFYGDGKNAVDILVTTFETVVGEDVADRKIRNHLRDTIDSEEYALLPERVKPMEESGSTTS